MIVEKTDIKDCYILEPSIFKDERGYFFESFNQDKFEKIIGTAINFVQDNQSFSTKGVLRGLHYQKGKYAQAKLVRVLEGKVLDVAVDIRKDSESYGKVVTTILSDENKKQMFVPRGCAHGFVALSETATFFYKCDNFYNKESESGIKFDDPSFKIDWELSKGGLIISEKDKVLPTFEEIMSLIQ